MTALPVPQVDDALQRFLGTARALGLTQREQAQLLGLHERTYRRRLKEGRLEPAEARVAAFLPRAHERVEALFGDPDRARSWMTTHNPRLGARPVDRLGDLEGYEEVLLIAGEAVYGFL